MCICIHIYIYVYMCIHIYIYIYNQIKSDACNVNTYETHTTLSLFTANQMYMYALCSYII